jgi:hypothetical protein
MQSYIFRTAAGVEVKIERIGKRLAGHLAENHPLIRLAQDVLTELELDSPTWILPRQTPIYP